MVCGGRRRHKKGEYKNMFVHRGLWQCDEQGKMNAYKALRWQSG